MHQVYYFYSIFFILYYIYYQVKEAYLTFYDYPGEPSKDLAL